MIHGTADLGDRVGKWGKLLPRAADRTVCEQTWLAFSDGRGVNVDTAEKALAALRTHTERATSLRVAIRELAGKIKKAER